MTAEKIKPFSAEWWVEQVRTVFWHLSLEHPKKEVKQLQRLSAFCLKRYAEAFHREKFSAMGNEDLVFRAYGQICELNGKTEERTRILGIIEDYNCLERIDRKTDELRPWTTEEKWQALIQKIKGE